MNEGYVIGKVKGHYSEDWIKGASVGFKTVMLDKFRIKLYDVDFANGKNWSPRWVDTNSDGEFVLPFIWLPTDLGDVASLFDSRKTIDSQISIFTNVRSGNEMRHRETTLPHPVQLHYFTSPQKVADGLIPTDLQDVGKDLLKRVYAARRKMKIPKIKVASPSAEWGILLADAGVIIADDF